MPERRSTLAELVTQSATAARWARLDHAKFTLAEKLAAPMLHGEIDFVRISIDWHHSTGPGDARFVERAKLLFLDPGQDELKSHLDLSFFDSEAFRDAAESVADCLIERDEPGVAIIGVQAHPISDTDARLVLTGPDDHTITFDFPNP